MNTKIIQPKYEGTLAAHEGRGPSTNPYPPTITAYYDWLEGYACEIEMLSAVFDEEYGLPQGHA